MTNNTVVELNDNVFEQKVQEEDKKEQIERSKDNLNSLVKLFEDLKSYTKFKLEVIPIFAKSKKDRTYIRITMNVYIKEKKHYSAFACITRYKTEIIPKYGNKNTSEIKSQDYDKILFNLGSFIWGLKKCTKPGEYYHKDNDEGAPGTSRMTMNLIVTMIEKYEKKQKEEKEKELKEDEDSLKNEIENVEKNESDKEESDKEEKKTVVKSTNKPKSIKKKDTN